MYDIDTKDGKYIFYVEKEEFNLDSSFNCGQIYNYTKETMTSGHSYGIYLKRDYVTLTQIGDIIYTNIKKNNKGVLDNLVHFLDLDTDYKLFYLNLDNNLSNSSSVYKNNGIHIFRQNFCDIIIFLLMSDDESKNRLFDILTKYSSYTENKAVKLPKYSVFIDELSKEKCKTYKETVRILKIVDKYKEFLDLSSSEMILPFLKENNFSKELISKIKLYCYHDLEVLPKDKILMDYVKKFPINFDKYDIPLGLIYSNIRLFTNILL